MLKFRLDKSYLSVLLFIYLLLISNFHNSLLSLLGILFCLLFINNPSYLLPQILLTSLLGDYFVAFSGIGMSRILAIIYLASVFFKKLCTGIYINKVRTIIFVIFSFYILLSSATSLTGSMTPAYVMILNILITLTMEFNTDDEFDDIITILRHCILILAINILFLILSGRAEYYYDRLVLHSSLNSNGLGMAIVQLMVILISTSANHNVRQNKIITFVALGFLLVVTLLTGSRTSLIAIMGSICVISIYYSATRKSGIKKVAIICIPICITLAVSYIIQHVNIDVLSRFSIDSVIETGGTGRQNIWIAALKDVFPRYPLFGVGFGVENTIAALEGSSLANNVGIHNMYISLLIQVGIVGSILFLSIIVGYYILSFIFLHKNTRILLPAMMITAALLNGIGEEVYAERFLWMAIGFSISMIKMQKQKELALELQKESKE